MTKQRKPLLDTKDKDRIILPTNKLINPEKKLILPTGSIDLNKQKINPNAKIDLIKTQQADINIKFNIRNRVLIKETHVYNLKKLHSKVKILFSGEGIDADGFFENTFDALIEHTMELHVKGSYIKEADDLEVGDIVVLDKQNSLAFQTFHVPNNVRNSNAVTAMLYSMSDTQMNELAKVKNSVVIEEYIIGFPHSIIANGKYEDFFTVNK